MLVFYWLNSKSLELALFLWLFTFVSDFSNHKSVHAAKTSPRFECLEMCSTECFIHVSAWKAASLVVHEGASEYFIYLGLYSAFTDASGCFPVEFSDSSTGLEGSKTFADAGSAFLNG